MQTGEVPADNSEEQIELRLSGLVRAEQNTLRVANPIYQAVFNTTWTATSLAKLRPYGAAIAAWLASNRLDDSRLLRGQSLQAALAWADESRSLADQDRLFLSASQALEQAATQTALEAEAEGNRILSEARQQAESELAAANQDLTATRAETEAAVLRGQRTRRRTAIIAGLAIAAATAATFWGGQRAIEANSDRQAAQAARQAAERSEQAASEAQAEKDRIEQAMSQAEQRLSQAQADVRTAEERFARASQQTEEAELIAQAAQAEVKAAQTEVQTAQQQLSSVQSERQQAQQAAEAARASQQVAEASAQQSNENLAVAQAEQAEVTADLDRVRTTFALEEESAQALQLFEAAPLDSLLVAMSAGQKLQQLLEQTGSKNNQVTTAPLTALNTILPAVTEKNQFTHPGLVNRVAFNEDDSLLITASMGIEAGAVARLWQAKTGKLLHELAGYQGIIIETGFIGSGEGSGEARADRSYIVTNTLTKSDGSTIGLEEMISGLTSITNRGLSSSLHIWDLSQPQPLQSFVSTNRTIHVARVSPDGQKLATLDQGNTAQIWDVQTGELRHELTGHQNLIRTVDFSADSQQIITASADKTARVWNANTGERLTTLAGHQRGIRAAKFSPDGRQVVTGANDATARIWNARTGELIHTLVGHQD
ncbi:MAG: hypothetical protein ACFB16_11445 [Phormidesmis sp.]